MVTEEIIERIKRLLAMRDGKGASETESEVAAMMARKLLNEHGLTLAEVEALGKEKTAVGKHVVEHEFLRPPPWVTSLLCGVADGFDCQVIGERHLLAVVGLEQDAAVAIYLFRVLRAQLERAADVAKKRMRDKGCRSRRLRNFRESFLLAAVERISYRLQETRRTASGHGGLIACKKSLVDQAMPKKTSSVGGTIRSCEGAYLGDAYGSRVHLGTDGIESKAAAPLALGHSVRGNV